MRVEGKCPNSDQLAQSPGCECGLRTQISHAADTFWTSPAFPRYTCVSLCRSELVTFTSTLQETVPNSNEDVRVERWEGSETGSASRVPVCLPRFLPKVLITLWTRLKRREQRSRSLAEAKLYLPR